MLVGCLDRPGIGCGYVDLEYILAFDTKERELY